MCPTADLHYTEYGTQFLPMPYQNTCQSLSMLLCTSYQDFGLKGADARITRRPTYRNQVLRDSIRRFLRGIV